MFKVWIFSFLPIISIFLLSYVFGYSVFHMSWEATPKNCEELLFDLPSVEAEYCQNHKEEIINKYRQVIEKIKDCKRSEYDQPFDVLNHPLDAIAKEELFDEKNKFEESKR